MDYKSRKMELLSNIERDAYKNGVLQGVQQGMQQGEATLLMTLMKYKFNDIPEYYISKINSADARTLERGGINVMNAKSLDEVFKNN